MNNLSSSADWQQGRKRAILYGQKKKKSCHLIAPKMSRSHDSDPSNCTLRRPSFCAAVGRPLSCGVWGLWPVRGSGRGEDAAGLEQGGRANERKGRERERERHWGVGFACGHRIVNHTYKVRAHASLHAGTRTCELRRQEAAQWPLVSFSFSPGLIIVAAVVRPCRCPVGSECRPPYLT